MFSPLQVKATDADGGSFGSITYSLGSGVNSAVPSQFTIAKETGWICTSTALDRDHGQTSFDFAVTAVDGVGRHRLKSSSVEIRGLTPPPTSWTQ